MAQNESVTIANPDSEKGCGDGGHNEVHSTKDVCGSEADVNVKPEQLQADDDLKEYTGDVDKLTE